MLGAGRVKIPFFGNLASRDMLADEYEVHSSKESEQRKVKWISKCSTSEREASGVKDAWGTNLTTARFSTAV